MFRTSELLTILEEYAPLEISHKAIQKGDYDNSGLLVKTNQNASKILFSLDLSVEAVKRAEEVGADTIVTHHPAIYNPIKSIDIDGENKALILAIKKGLSIISMHLNLDMAKMGIDYYLAKGLGAAEDIILDDLDGVHGYGRQFKVGKDAEEFLNSAEKELGTDKILFYGNGIVECCASFCGGGSSHALNMVKEGKTDADLIVSSDMPHHILQELIEGGKKVMIIPHYVSENYGFNKFYEWALERLDKKALLYYFEDKRFM